MGGGCLGRGVGSPCEQYPQKHTKETFDTATHAEFYLMALADIQSPQLLASLTKNFDSSWGDVKAAKHFEDS